MVQKLDVATAATWGIPHASSAMNSRHTLMSLHHKHRSVGPNRRIKYCLPYPKTTHPPSPRTRCADCRCLFWS